MDLEPGQVWSYRTRPGEEQSRLTVLEVETIEGIGEVVHVAIDGLSPPNPVDPTRPNTGVGHVPVASEVLRASLVAHVGDADGPLDLSGIAYWRQATGGTSAYTLDVAAIVDTIAEALTGGTPG